MACAHFGRALEVEFRRQVKRRDGADRLGEPAGDRLPDLCERNISIVLAERGAHWSRRAVGRCRSHDTGSSFHIALDDAAAGTGTAYRAEIEATLGSEAAG
jgi:hypothetical protein